MNNKAHRVPTHIAALIVALVIGGTVLTNSDRGATEPAPTCNGYIELCQRPYDEVAFLTAHNAMSNFEDGWRAANQNLNIASQLSLGVRAFMIDIHPQNDFPLGARGDEAWLCHGLCALGKRRLADQFAEFKTYSDSHPHEVITLILESYVDPHWIKRAADEAGITSMFYSHPNPDDPWPSLSELIQARTPFVVLTDSDAYTFPWLMPLYGEATSTHWDAQTVDDFRCTLELGSSSNQLVILNNFLTQTIGRPAYAQTVNVAPFLDDRVDQCSDATGRLLNFITLDFVDIGVGPSVIDRLNRVGRFAPTTSTTSTTTTSSTSTTSTTSAATSRGSSVDRPTTTWVQESASQDTSTRQPTKIEPSSSSPTPDTLRVAPPATPLQRSVTFAG